MAEDWTIVLLGFLIIGPVVFGMALPEPTFGWKNGIELLEKVLAVPNLLALAGQLLFSMFILGLGAWLAQKPVKNALIAVPPSLSSGSGLARSGQECTGESL